MYSRSVRLLRKKCCNRVAARTRRRSSSNRFCAARRRSSRCNTTACHAGRRDGLYEGVPSTSTSFSTYEPNSAVTSAKSTYRLTLASSFPSDRLCLVCPECSLNLRRAVVATNAFSVLKSRLRTSHQSLGLNSGAISITNDNVPCARCGTPGGGLGSFIRSMHMRCGTSDPTAGQHI